MQIKTTVRHTAAPRKAKHWTDSSKCGTTSGAGNPDARLGQWHVAANQTCDDPLLRTWIQSLSTSDCSGLQASNFPLLLAAVSWVSVTCSESPDYPESHGRFQFRPWRRPHFPNFSKCTRAAKQGPLSTGKLAVSLKSHIIILKKENHSTLVTYFIIFCLNVKVAPPIVKWHWHSTKPHGVTEGPVPPTHDSVLLGTTERCLKRTDLGTGHRLRSLQGQASKTKSVQEAVPGGQLPVRPLSVAPWGHPRSPRSQTHVQGTATPLTPHTSAAPSTTGQILPWHHFAKTGLFPSSSRHFFQTERRHWARACMCSKPFPLSENQTALPSRLLKEKGPFLEGNSHCLWVLTSNAWVALTWPVWTRRWAGTSLMWRWWYGPPTTLWCS